MAKMVYQRCQERYHVIPERSTVETKRNKEVVRELIVPKEREKGE
jgi:hypothetical protein